MLERFDDTAKPKIQPKMTFNDFYMTSEVKVDL